jgi:hypothetical protein
MKKGHVGGEACWPSHSNCCLAYQLLTLLALFLQCVQISCAALAVLIFKSIVKSISGTSKGLLLTKYFTGVGASSARM